PFFRGRWNPHDQDSDQLSHQKIGPITTVAKASSGLNPCRRQVAPSLLRNGASRLHWDFRASHPIVLMPPFGASAPMWYLRSVVRENPLDPKALKRLRTPSWMSLEQLERLAAGSEAIRVRRPSTIFTAGQASNRVYIMLS